MPAKIIRYKIKTFFKVLKSLKSRNFTANFRKNKIKYILFRFKTDNIIQN